MTSQGDLTQLPRMLVPENPVPAPYSQFGRLCRFTPFDGIQQKFMLHVSRLVVNLHEFDTSKMAYVKSPQAYMKLRRRHHSTTVTGDMKATIKWTFRWAPVFGCDFARSDTAHHVKTVQLWRPTLHS
jgi:hypothetical protein